jgi:hypothetical protein
MAGWSGVWALIITLHYRRGMVRQLNLGRTVTQCTASDEFFVVKPHPQA